MTPTPPQTRRAPQPIRRHTDTYSGRAVTALRDMILAGDLLPGERLNEVELAEALGISRAPLREAIQRLRSEGLLTGVSGRGAYVRLLTVTDLQELFDLRIVLEIHALRLVAAHADTSALLELKSDVTTHGHLLETYPSRPEEHDFHIRLARLAGSTALLNAVTDVHRQTQLVRQRIADSNHEHPDRIVEEHTRIVDALLDNNVEQAIAVHVEHLEATMREGLDILRTQAAAP